MDAKYPITRKKTIPWDGFEIARWALLRMRLYFCMESRLHGRAMTKHTKANREIEKPTDVRVRAAELYLLPAVMRVPLKFGQVVLDKVLCPRVRLTVEGRGGRVAEGWGESPLSVGWAWPGELPYAEREKILLRLVEKLGRAFVNTGFSGHALEIGVDFQEQVLPELLAEFSAEEGMDVPLLAALVCLAPYDLALHDAYGVLNDAPVYATYNKSYLNRDLAAYLEADSGVAFKGKYPADFFRPQRADTLPVWHLVGGMDPLEEAELGGEEPDDGYPVLLRDWIRRDGLKCLKVKLRGNDWDWDYNRILQTGRIAVEEGADWLTTDYNCTAPDVEYVNRMLDRLRDEHPRLHGMILYVEQPFPYELEKHALDVHSVAARKPLFLDESAHNWKKVRLGRGLGWNGVALKTCKTQSGALLAGCWALAHGMTLMVQDLTNPMLAQIPHVLLAAHLPTIMGVESNAMQFYPEASLPEAAVHPDLYARRGGVLDLGTLHGPGFGYRLSKIRRDLPESVARFAADTSNS